MASAPFCTCKDHACPLNPHNHDKGCTLCVEKCLKLGEIRAASLSSWTRTSPAMRTSHWAASSASTRRTQKRTAEFAAPDPEAILQGTV